MRSDTTEYLDAQHQTQPSRAFKIERAEEPDTAIILQARDDATSDRQLTDGARVLFVKLLDWSLNRDTWDRVHRRGSVLISNRKLQEKLWRSGRAIYGWVKELVEQRHIWVSKRLRPNTRPMNVYHITALQPKKEHGPEVTGDGMWGNGYRRHDQEMPKGARGAICKKRHYLFDHFGRPIFSQPADNKPVSGKTFGSNPQVLREPTAQKDPCQPQNLRVASEQKDTCQPQNSRVRAAKSSPSPQQKGAVCTESIDVSSRSFESFNNVQRANAGKKGSEKQYLDRVLETLSLWKPSWAQKEMVNSGAWWRLAYRANQDKAERILAEISRMIKEGETFTVNPGAAAVDLWDRFASHK